MPIKRSLARHLFDLTRSDKVEQSGDKYSKVVHAVGLLASSWRTQGRNCTYHHPSMCISNLYRWHMCVCVWVFLRISHFISIPAHAVPFLWDDISLFSARVERVQALIPEAWFKNWTEKKRNVIQEHGSGRRNRVDFFIPRRKVHSSQR